MAYSESTLGQQLSGYCYVSVVWQSYSALQIFKYKALLKFQQILNLFLGNTKVC